MTSEESKAVDGLELAGVQWMGTGHFRKKLPSDAIPSHWDSLCRMKDAHRLLAQRDAAHIEELAQSGEQLMAQARTIMRRDAEIAALKAGMVGVYDLDSWLDWAAEAKVLRAQVTELNAEIEKFKDANRQLSERRVRDRDKIAALESQQVASSCGVYSADPLVCTGCISGCFRCNTLSGHQQ